MATLADMASRTRPMLKRKNWVKFEKPATEAEKAAFPNKDGSTKDGDGKRASPLYDAKRKKPRG